MFFTLSVFSHLPGQTCKSLYENIHSMTGGSIVWSYLKPLLMGKVLYSPNTPETQLIMQQVSRQFSSYTRRWWRIECNTHL